MNYELIEKNINSGKLSSIYLLYGKEKYLIESIVKKIKKQFDELLLGINYVMIDETTTENIISDIQTPAFGYDKKLIIAKNTGLFKKETKRKNVTSSSIQEKISDYISENINIIKDSTIIVFIEDEAEKNTLYNTIDKLGVICNFEYLKPIQLEENIKKICNMYKVKIDNDTLKYFVQNCGNNMQDLINEIRKLIEYAGENGIIDKQIIDKLSIKQIESVIFDLTDKLGNKKIGDALFVLDNLIYSKEPIQKILVTLYNHFKKLYLCKIANEENKDIIYALNLKPNQTFLVSKYRNQANYFKKHELRSILKELTDLDYNYKLGKIDIDVGLRAILCNYCS